MAPAVILVITLSSRLRFRGGLQPTLTTDCWDPTTYWSSTCVAESSPDGYADNNAHPRRRGRQLGDALIPPGRRSSQVLVPPPHLGPHYINERTRKTTKTHVGLQYSHTLMDTQGGLGDLTGGGTGPGARNMSSFPVHLLRFSLGRLRGMSKLTLKC